MLSSAEKVLDQMIFENCVDPLSVKFRTLLSEVREEIAEIEQFEAFLADEIVDPVHDDLFNGCHIFLLGHMILQIRLDLFGDARHASLGFEMRWALLSAGTSAVSGQLVVDIGNRAFSIQN